MVGILERTVEKIEGSVLLRKVEVTRRWLQRALDEGRTVPRMENKVSYLVDLTFCSQCGFMW